MLIMPDILFNLLNTVWNEVKLLMDQVSATDGCRLPGCGPGLQRDLSHGIQNIPGPYAKLLGSELGWNQTWVQCCGFHNVRTN